MDMEWILEGELSGGMEEIPEELIFSLEGEAKQVSKFVGEMKKQYPDNKFEWEYDKDNDMYYIYHDFDLDNLSEEVSRHIIELQVSFLDSVGISSYSFGNRGVAYGIQS